MFQKNFYIITMIIMEHYPIYHDNHGALSYVQNMFSKIEL